jgi:hypothetical protein
MLDEVIRYAQETGKDGKIAEVALATVRILEVVKKEADVTWEDAENILDTAGNLEEYINHVQL